MNRTKHKTAAATLGVSHTRERQLTSYSRQLAGFLEADHLLSCAREAEQGQTRAMRGVIAVTAVLEGV